MNITRDDLILLNIAGIGKKKLEKFTAGELSVKIEALKREHGGALDGDLKLINKNKIEILTILDKKYPRLLKEIYSPPLVLYIKGEFLKESEFAVAIVGSRLASVYGISSAESLGYELASRGVVVVSGLARGIDTAAHKGAVQAHGKTVAVLGGGLGDIYPPENKKFADEIIGKAGAVISEFPMQAPPIPRNFPQRNRIISGLSLATIVVEAAKNSGALITADFALEQGREVFAVPGKIDSSTSFGTNDLIKQGARLIQTADDVIEELKLKLKSAGPEGAGAGRLPEPNLSCDEEIVYKSLSTEPKYLDDVTESARLPLSKTTEALFRLQLKKLAKELPGKNFVKV